eukprot:1183835-Prorocentrum_minimum.AAC.3
MNRKDRGMRIKRDFRFHRAGGATVRTDRRVPTVYKKVAQREPMVPAWAILDSADKPSQTGQPMVFLVLVVGDGLIY